MPSISTPSKIAATKALTRNVVFSGSTAEERERKVEEVIKETEAILVPPYDHADVIMGQGTVGREMEGQFAARRGDERCAVYMGEGAGDVEAGDEMEFKRPDKQFGAIIAPCGGGGLLSGIATYFSSPGSSSDSDCSTSSTSSSAQHHHEAAGTMKKTPLIFGAEPSFEDADDARRSLARHPPSRIESVKSLTIADGLRTPLGKLNWDVIRQKAKVEGVYAVGEEEIKESVRLMMERAKWVVEPSAAVPLAVILFNEEFRAMVENRQREEREREGQVTAWEVGVVVSGGNTTVEAIVALFGPQDKAEGGDEGEDGDVETEVKREREKGTIAMDGDRIAENVAG